MKFLKKFVALALVLATVLSISAVALAGKTLTWSDHYGSGTLYSNTPGDVNHYVRNLQYDLRQVLEDSNLKVDGYYGKATKDAVKAFQEANSLSVDGMAGPATKAALFSQVSCSGDHPQDK